MWCLNLVAGSFWKVYQSLSKMGVIMLYYIIDLINYYYNDYLTAFTILSQFYFCKLGQSFSLTLYINTNALFFFWNWDIPLMNKLKKD